MTAENTLQDMIVILADEPLLEGVPQQAPQAVPARAEPTTQPEARAFRGADLPTDPFLQATAGPKEEPALEMKGVAAAAIAHGLVETTEEEFPLAAASHDHLDAGDKEVLPTAPAAQDLVDQVVEKAHSEEVSAHDLLDSRDKKVPPTAPAFGAVVEETVAKAEAEEAIAYDLPDSEEQAPAAAVMIGDFAGRAEEKILPADSPPESHFESGEAELLTAGTALRDFPGEEEQALVTAISSQDLVEAVEHERAWAEGPTPDPVEGVEQEPPTVKRIGDEVPMPSDETPGAAAKVMLDKLAVQQAPARPTCIICKKENPPSGIFCERCGAVVAPAGATCPSCGHHNATGSLYCDGCQSRLGLAGLV